MSDDLIPNSIEIAFKQGNIISESDIHGRITYVNRLFCEMTGYTKAELIGQPHSIIRHPDMPKKCYEHLWNNIKSGISWEGYIKNLRKDGAYYWVNASIHPKYDEVGSIIGYIALQKPPGKTTLEEIKEHYSRLLSSQICI
jgi:PAS domain S-box-containing protein